MPLIITPSKPPKIRTRRRKTIRAKEVEDRYRPRLHRTVGVYLALKAWARSVDCVVLSSNDLFKFFDMTATPRDRMEQIRNDVRPWFRGFIASRPQSNNPTFVNYLFLIRREEDESYFRSGTPLSLSGVKLLIEKVNKSDKPAPKSALCSELMPEGQVPTQAEILSELVLVVS